MGSACEMVCAQGGLHRESLVKAGLHVGVCVWASMRKEICIYTTGYKGKSTLLVREPETFKHQAGTLSKFVLRGGIKIQLWGKLAKKKYNKVHFHYISGGSSLRSCITNGLLLALRVREDFTWPAATLRNVELELVLIPSV